MAAWWQRKVVYEIFVPCFQDSNGDGIGDLNGIADRLDYLADLGIGAIWLSPFYQSPLFDAGYDVSDHKDVAGVFGDLQDFDNLLQKAHQRDLRIVIDYVPNHTSNQHPWFAQASRSRDDRLRDWYIWHDPKHDGTPPNNWLNRYGRSAWTFHEATGQYYFSTFTPEQPDLNWRCPELRQAMFDILRFWLDRGADGVRVDALAHLIKDSLLRDNPISLGYSDDQEPSNVLKQFYSQNQPELYDLIGEMRQVVDQYPQRLLMGEAYQVPEQIAAYQRAGAQILLNTSLLQGCFEAAALRNSIDQLEALTAKSQWPSRSAGNHDIPRLACRVGEVNLRLAALLQFTVRGAATMYYGDELGLQPLQLEHTAMRDPSGRDNPRYSRDHSRSPMPWDHEANSGFSPVEPWLPIDDQTAALNVQRQRDDVNSLYNFYRTVLHLRNEHRELQSGDYHPIDVSAPIVAFYRRTPESSLLVAMNIGDSCESFDIQGLRASRMLSTAFGDQPCEIDHTVTLQPREGIVAAVS